jgi:hypothetical protein
MYELFDEQFHVSLPRGWEVRDNAHLDEGTTVSDCSHPGRPRNAPTHIQHPAAANDRVCATAGRAMSNFDQTMVIDRA